MDQTPSQMEENNNICEGKNTNQCLTIANFYLNVVILISYTVVVIWLIAKS
jgi:hypothetical protein